MVERSVVSHGAYDILESVAVDVHKRRKTCAPISIERVSGENGRKGELILAVVVREKRCVQNLVDTLPIECQIKIAIVVIIGDIGDQIRDRRQRHRVMDERLTASLVFEPIDAIRVPEDHVAIAITSNVFHAKARARANGAREIVGHKGSTSAV